MKRTKQALPVRDHTSLLVDLLEWRIGPQEYRDQAPEPDASAVKLVFYRLHLHQAVREQRPYVVREWAQVIRSIADQGFLIFEPRHADQIERALDAIANPDAHPWVGKSLQPILDGLYKDDLPHTKGQEPPWLVLGTRISTILLAIAVVTTYSVGLDRGTLAIFAYLTFMGGLFIHDWVFNGLKEAAEMQLAYLFIAGPLVATIHLAGSI